MKKNILYNTVLKMYEDGFNKSFIAKNLSLNRSTVNKWLKEPLKTDNKNLSIENLENKNKVYSYVLGLYLGDGYINKTDRAYRLRIFLDKKYTTLNSFAKSKLSELFEKNKIGITETKSNCVVLSVYNKNLPTLFPQHGKGLKHNRTIDLSDWQIKLIDWLELIRGLFHSDGSYYFDRDRDYFNFRNYSKEILEIFKLCCEKLLISYTTPNDVTVRVGKRKDVQKLVELIGNKDNIVL
jgi:hypothetical protein